MDRGNIDLDKVKLDPKDQEFIDKLDKASERLKQGGGDPLNLFKEGGSRQPRVTWLRGSKRVALFYLGCLALGLILGGAELVIMRLTGYVQ